MFTPHRLVFLQSADTQHQLDALDANGEADPHGKEALDKMVLAQKMRAKFNTATRAGIELGEWHAWESSFGSMTMAQMQQTDSFLDECVVSSHDVTQTFKNIDLLERSNISQFEKTYLTNELRWYEENRGMSDPMSKDRMAKFKENVNAALKRTPDRQKSLARFKKLQTRPGAAGAMMDVRVTFDDTRPGGYQGEVRGETGFLSDKEFNKLSLPQQEQYLKSLEESYAKNIPDHDPQIIAEGRRLLQDNRMPKSWRDGLEDPASWTDGGGSGEGGRYTRAEIVGWIRDNESDLRYTEARYDTLTANPAVIGFLADHGEQVMDEQDFFNKSRDEREAYLDQLEAARDGSETAFAEKKRVSEARDVHGVQATQTEIATREREEAETRREMADALKRSVTETLVRESAQFRANIDAKQAEQKKTDDFIASTQIDRAALADASPLGVIVGGIKNIFGFGRGQKETTPTNRSTAIDDVDDEDDARTQPEQPVDNRVAMHLTDEHAAVTTAAIDHRVVMDERSTAFKGEVEGWMAHDKKNNLKLETSCGLTPEADATKAAERAQILARVTAVVLAKNDRALDALLREPKVAAVFLSDKNSLLQHVRADRAARAERTL